MQLSGACVQLFHFFCQISVSSLALIHSDNFGGPKKPRCIWCCQLWCSERQILHQYFFYIKILRIRSFKKIIWSYCDCLPVFGHVQAPWGLLTIKMWKGKLKKNCIARTTTFSNSVKIIWSYCRRFTIVWLTLIRLRFLGSLDLCFLQEQGLLTNIFHHCFICLPLLFVRICFLVLSVHIFLCGVVLWNPLLAF